MVRPPWSFRPWSDSIGIADGRSSRTSTDAPASAPISAASAALTSASRPPGPVRAEPVEAPESIVHAVHLDAGHAAPAGLVRHGAFDGDHGTDRAGCQVRRE
jgi:hypothetical protein